MPLTRNLSAMRRSFIVRRAQLRQASSDSSRSCGLACVLGAGNAAGCRSRPARIPLVKLAFRCYNAYTQRMKSEENPAYSIVVPFFNEQENVAQLYVKITEVMDAIGEPYEMVFIDDASKD